MGIGKESGFTLTEKHHSLFFILESVSIQNIYFLSLFPSTDSGYNQTSTYNLERINI